MAKQPTLRETADGAVRDRILNELAKQCWHMSTAALVLGYTRQGLHAACKRLGIDVRRERARAEKAGL